MDGARVLSRDELRDLAAEHGLEHLADEVVSCSRLAVVLRDVGESAGDGLGSRLGVPRRCRKSSSGRSGEAGRSPSRRVRLDQVAPFDEDSLLPPDGVLFFRDSAAVAAAAGGELVDDEAGWGFDPADAGSARVFHHLPGPLVPRSAPNGMPTHGALPLRRSSLEDD